MHALPHRARFHVPEAAPQDTVEPRVPAFAVPGIMLVLARASRDLAAKLKAVNAVCALSPRPQSGAAIRDATVKDWTL
jgi:hypothetical protein